MRGFLNEIKNTAINRATNRVNNLISEAIGGGTGLPRRTGGVVSQDAYAKMDNPFDGNHIAYGWARDFLAPEIYKFINRIQTIPTQ